MTKRIEDFLRYPINDPDVPVRLVSIFEEEAAELLCPIIEANNGTLELPIHPYFDYPDEALGYSEERDELLRAGLAREKALAVFQSFRGLRSFAKRCARIGTGTIVYIPTNQASPTPRFDDHPLRDNANPWRSLGAVLDYVYDTKLAILSGAQLRLEHTNYHSYAMPSKNIRPLAHKIATRPNGNLLAGCVGYTFANMVKTPTKFDITISRTTTPKQWF